MQEKKRIHRNKETGGDSGLRNHSLDKLKDSVLGDVFNYNKNRTHKGIGGKTYIEKLTV